VFGNIVCVNRQLIRSEKILIKENDVLVPKEFKIIFC